MEAACLAIININKMIDGDHSGGGTGVYDDDEGKYFKRSQDLSYVTACMNSLYENLALE